MRSASGGRRLTAAALEGRQFSLVEDLVVSRKELAQCARNAMKAIKMRPSLRLVLAELVGCWGETTLQNKIYVWPSNEYLIERTGLSERAVRYGIRGLVKLQIIVPKDSANGKRFAIKNRGGSLVDVYGFDLTPIYARRGEWIEGMAAIAADREARARLFDEITICRRVIADVLESFASQYPLADAGALTGAFTDLTEQTPRRNLSSDLGPLQTLVDRYRKLRHRSEQEFYKAASGGKSCQHIETNPLNLKSEDWNKSSQDRAGRVESPSPTIDLGLVTEVCREILDYVEPIRTEVDLVAAARYVRGSLGASPSTWDEAVEVLGPIKAAVTVLLVLQLHANDARAGTNRIKNPGGYLRAMIRMVADGRVDLVAELFALRRKNGAG